MQSSPNSPTNDDQPAGIAPADAHDPYSALRYPGYRLFLIGHAVSVFGLQMQTAAVFWQIYRITRDPLALSGVGLVQILPVVGFALIAGHVADRFDRRRVVMICLATMTVASSVLALISSWEWGTNVAGQVAAIYGCLLANGIARAFLQPSKASLLPLIVPRASFANAVTWNMSVFQISAVAGPAAAGWIIDWFDRAMAVYILDATACILFFVLLSQIRVIPQARETEANEVGKLTAGVKFVWQNKILLGAMALDMFAVLLGGATALLPMVAEDILHVGARGYGWLLSAPAVGALITSVTLAHRPPIEHAGRALLWAVAGFGVATIIFGLSTSFMLSLAMLFFTGVFDMVSVVVRHTLVQLVTPDDKRGRVSAINSMFIGASNELGGAESGLLAKLFSAQASIVAGGVGTLLVVSAAAFLFPKLRRFGRLDGTPPDSAP